ncbi:hypothetical protein, partial [Planktothrix mougeotii]|uniref:hypothetical protein n=1 Tax=Planktothrix mougeotii TaxID=54306 RepID=UPI001D144A91
CAFGSFVSQAHLPMYLISSALSTPFLNFFLIQGKSLSGKGCSFSCLSGDGTIGKNLLVMAMQAGYYKK